MSLDSAHKVTQMLKLQVYHMHEIHKLQPTDHVVRLCYCHWPESFICNNIKLLDDTFF